MPSDILKIFDDVKIKTINEEINSLRRIISDKESERKSAEDYLNKPGIDYVSRTDTEGEILTCNIEISLIEEKIKGLEVEREGIRAFYGLSPQEVSSIKPKKITTRVNTGVASRAYHGRTSHVR
ncbi:MAG TPA: hypothetical protein PKJ33_04025 [Alphaproteobacteria bacterium]|nr:hypothetical protein [Alphaproteobacteria bacterium]